MKRLFVLGVALASVSTIAGIAIGFFGFLHPAFDTFAHLRFHFALCLLLSGAVLILARYRRLAVGSLVVSVVALYTTLPGLQLSAVEMQPRSDRQTYSLLHLNLLWNHENPAPVVNWLVEQNADLVSLAEASHIWTPHLGKLDANYPYFFNCPENGKRGGVRVYSKWPFVGEKDYCADYGVFGTTRAITPEGDTVTIGSLHLRWPWPASGPRQMDAILPEVAQLGPDALIIGDFNATTWSHALDRFSRTGNLTIIPGIGPTWLFEEIPAWIAEWVGFPIDNAAFKGRVRIVNAIRLESVRSDHFPIRINFQISPR